MVEYILWHSETAEEFQTTKSIYTHMHFYGYEGLWDFQNHIKKLYATFLSANQYLNIKII